MRRIKIIGIGSPFGQDQLGWQVIELLETLMTPTEKQHVQLIKTDRPGIQLLALLKNVDIAILIDAIDDSSKTGQIINLDKSQLLLQNKPFSSHALGVSEALRVGDALKELPKLLRLFGLCININNTAPVPKQDIYNLASVVMDSIKTPDDQRTENSIYA